MNKSRLSLEGKVALVTGSARGIGRAIALALADAGADVIVDDREKALQEAEGVAGAIRKMGRRSVAVAANIRNIGDIDKLVEKIGEFGRIDILVNNAGTNPAMAIEDFPLPEGPNKARKGCSCKRRTNASTSASRPKKNSWSSLRKG